ncbi:NF-kappa-B inhibitor-like protein 1 isoform X2 [Thamnophis elegans]|uniref:NF-kappa-B inhibitor-like protein 1 isoform X2 n=1 Tax=Thamnophis elegans TaxID=35005 RepID=UPI001376CF03|nr:NF-kappa-B inhibitor-like protein 1 isoform X2 [Thamnophis elegans]
MALRYQRRLWRYVERGRRHKLHRLLRHHRDVLDLGERKGHKNHTPLHRCCALLDRKAAALLLKYGADPSLPDHQGDTALHLAARQVARGGDHAYEDLFVPLRINCPSAMSIKNRAGKTPGDLLNTAAEEKWCPEATLEENEAETEAEREWRCKLLNECEDEFQETPWQHEDFSTGPNSETFEEWTERIRREYGQKRRQEEEQRYRRPKKETTKPSVQLQRLEQEHLEYLKRAQAKEEEIQAGKRRRYEEGCSRVFSSSDSSHSLCYKDIPWPSLTGTPEEMAAAALRGVDPSDRGAYRRFLRRQQALWHPDKFAQRCGTRLAEQDRRWILDTVTALSQAFNRLAEAAK